MRGEPLWEVVSKAQEKEGVVVTHIEVLVQFLEMEWSSLPGLARETGIHVEIPLINVRVPYKRATSTVFSELLLCLLVL